MAQSSTGEPGGTSVKRYGPKSKSSCSFSRPMKRMSNRSAAPGPVPGHGTPPEAHPPSFAQAGRATRRAFSAVARTLLRDPPVLPLVHRLTCFLGRGSII